MFDKQVYINRRLELRKRIKSGLVLILGNAESPMNYRSNSYRFRQDSSFLYFFGLDLPNLVGVIDIEDGRDSLYGDDFDIDDIIWMGPQPSLSELGGRVGVLSTHPHRDLYGAVNRAIQQGRRVHILPPYRPDNILLLERLLGINQQMVKSYASVELVRAVVALRSIKEDCEIEELERAAAVGYRMHVAAMRMAKPGATERELAGHIEGISIAHRGHINSPWLHALVPHHPIAERRDAPQPRPFSGAHRGPLAAGGRWRGERNALRLRQHAHPARGRPF